MGVIIIAEAGVNHNGSMEMARRMVQTGAAAGVDYVKFQTFSADRIVSRTARQADYQRRNLGTDTAGADDSQYAMLKALELSGDNFAELAEYCRQCGTRFMSTPFDIESIDTLRALNMDYMKVPSGEITNLPYLRAVAAAGLPVIMSTGMATMPEIEQAVEALYKSGLSTDQLTLLHCTTEYPAPPADVNLRVMDTLRSAFGTRVGYSDHTEGIEISLAAVAMGAEVIEKHFTLDRTLPGPDHVASLDPEGLNALVRGIRLVETAMGHAAKTVSDAEMRNRLAARKSIVAAQPIAAGQLITADMLTVKRPGSGLSPMLWDSVVGTPATRDYSVDEPIEM